MTSCNFELWTMIHVVYLKQITLSVIDAVNSRWFKSSS